MADQDLSKLRIDKTEKPGSPKRRVNKYAIAAVIVIVALLALYAAGVFTPAKTVQALTAARVFPSQSLTVLTASGYVTAERRAAVASKVTGLLMARYVEEGSRVKQGQLIARLESEDVEAAARQARANLNVARANLDQAVADETDAARQFQRNKELVARGYIARSDYDTSEARYRKAQAAVESARAAVKSSQAALSAAEVAVEYTMIRAPFDGVVLTKNADIGDIVTPLGAAANAKAAVVTIADLNSLQVEADVSESSVGLVKIGQPCEIQLDALPDTRFPAVVHMIVPTADRTKATIMVKVRFEEKDARILPDMSTKVAFLSRRLAPEEREPRLAVPKGAVRDVKGQPAVFVISNNRAESTAVRTGRDMGDMVEVTSGLKAGDRIIVNPPAGLSSGDQVKIAEK